MTASINLLVKGNNFCCTYCSISFRAVDHILSIFSSYDLMLWCWKMESSERPAFAEIKEYLEGLIEEKMSNAYYLALPMDPFLDG